MLQSLNDVQSVIQESAQLLLTSDMALYQPADPLIPPLKFVCTHATDWSQIACYISYMDTNFVSNSKKNSRDNYFSLPIKCN